MTPLFSLGGLKKSFDGAWNLSVENLVINAGDGIFLRGNNGSGKTTLLKILAGLSPPDELSSLEYNGKPRRYFPCGAPVWFICIRRLICFPLRCAAMWNTDCAVAACPRHWPPMRSIGPGYRTWPLITPTNFPAANKAAVLWRVLRRYRRTWFCWMNRSLTWMLKVWRWRLIWLPVCALIIVRSCLFLTIKSLFPPIAVGILRTAG